MPYKKKTEDLVRTFHIEMPSELIPIYQELQKVYNLILSSDDKKLILLNKIQYGRTGDVWNQMGRLFNTFVYEKLEGKIPNKAWFTRMVYENLRRTVESQREKVAIFEILKANEFKIDKKLKTELNSAGLYTTYGGLENLKDSRKKPQLPRKAVFVMDYSVYSQEMFLMDETDNTKMKFKYSKKDWLDLNIILPFSLRLNLTGKLGKPCFYFKNGQYVGDVRYYVKPYESHGENILGVDYGRKFIYSASVLYENGATSQQYLPSKRLQSLNVKKEKILNEINLIRNKIIKNEPYLASSRALKETLEKQGNRVSNDLNNRQKIINIKEKEAELSAVELVNIALQNQCSEIHIDYLKWLKSRGGKWNFSACQDKLVSIAELYGIKVVSVNTAYSSQTHPITKEIGKEVGRDIVFSDGERINRDYVASINHSKRNGFKNRNMPEKTVKKINKRSFKKIKFTSVKEIKRKMKEVLTRKGGTQIVAFSPVQPDASRERRLELGFIAKHSLIQGHVFEKQSLQRRFIKQ